MEQMSVIIKDQQIAGIEKAADGQEVIDLKNHTLMPGLMDMHLDITRIRRKRLLTPSSGTRQIGPAGNRLRGRCADGRRTTVRNLGGITS